MLVRASRSSESRLPEIWKPPTVRVPLVVVSRPLMRRTRWTYRHRVADDCKDFAAVNAEGDVVHSNYRLGPLPKTLETPSRTTMGSVLSPKLCTSSLISLYPLYVVVGALGHYRPYAKDGKLS